MGALDITIQEGEGDNILSGEIREGTRIPIVSKGSRSQAAGAAEIKTIWKRREDQRY
jgi:uncharacterized Zn finger protein